MRNCKKVYVEVRAGHLTNGVFDTESRKRFVGGKNRVITQDIPLTLFLLNLNLRDKKLDEVM